MVKKMQNAKCKMQNEKVGGESLEPRVKSREPEKCGTSLRLVIPSSVAEVCDLGSLMSFARKQHVILRERAPPRSGGLRLKNLASITLNAPAHALVAACTPFPPSVIPSQTPVIPAQAGTQIHFFAVASSTNAISLSVRP
jgi:hypothetical protein